MNAEHVHDVQLRMTCYGRSNAAPALDMCVQNRGPITDRAGRSCTDGASVGPQLRACELGVCSLGDKG